MIKENTMLIVIATSIGMALSLELNDDDCGLEQTNYTNSNSVIVVQNNLLHLAVWFNM